MIIIGIDCLQQNAPSQLDKVSTIPAIADRSMIVSNRASFSAHQVLADSVSLAMFTILATQNYRLSRMYRKTSDLM